MICKGTICKTKERIWTEERIVGYNGINTESPYKVRISVGCGARTLVKVREEGKGIPNQPSKGPASIVKSGSGTGWVGS